MNCCKSWFVATWLTNFIAKAPAIAGAFFILVTIPLLQNIFSQGFT